MKKILLSIFFVMNVLFAWGQTATLKGKVIDSKSLKPLNNVVTTIISTNTVAVTNAAGIFEFTHLDEGDYTLQIRLNDFVPQVLPVSVTKSGVTDLGTIALDEDITTELQLSLITITESDLGDDNSGSENTAGLLQASRDVFLQIAAFNWGQARYRVRGLDNEYGNTLINGISMNKIYDGRPQWGNWGGLNDATRNQEFISGSKANDYTFGSLLGTQEINTRASFYRPGARVSFSGTNTNYNWRTMGTYASGLNKQGWAYVISASGRWAKEGHFEGTNYSAISVFASIEKKFNDKHSLNFTSIAANNSRGKNSPLTQEQIDIMGSKYNSYWGWQDGKKRNSRYKDMLEPINMLSHYWTISKKTTLNTNVAYQSGYIANSRLDFQNAPNPDPTYYRNLPSYYLNNFNGNVWEPQYEKAADALNYFKQNAQINWNNLYRANLNTSDNRSVYALYEDRTQDKLFSANSIFVTELADNVTFNSAINYKKLSSHNFQKLTDLLGGQYMLDIDPFFSGNARQVDLNNPNRTVEVGDQYGYNYKLNADVIDAFTQFRMRFKKVDVYLAQQFSRSEYRREGLYRNGIYPTNSFGKSKAMVFENFGFKGGVTYRITGNHMIDVNGLYQTKAPTLRNTFANARLNNVITPDLKSESVYGGDAAYIIRTPHLKGRISGFYNRVSDATKLAFFYAEGIGGDETGGDSDAFISEILTGVQKQNMGVELGLEYNITSTLKAIAGATYGQYTYSDNANVKYNEDALAAKGESSIVDLGTAYLKNYRQGGMPQQAYSFGLEYRDPKFWWIGANVNYLDDLYIDPSAILRTKNFVTNSENGIPYPGMTDADVKKVLKQEKLNSFTLVNLQGGKSWRVSNKNRNTIGFFASINNVFDVTYKTGGFEQARKASYKEIAQDMASGIRSFGPKYFHGYGRTFFANVYFNF